MKFTPGLALGGLCILASAPATAQELVQDGGFEAGLGPWKTFQGSPANGSPVAAKVQVTSPHGRTTPQRAPASNHALLISNHSYFHAGVSQKITGLHAGDAYRVSFYAEKSGVGEAAAVAVFGASQNYPYRGEATVFFPGVEQLVIASNSAGYAGTHFTVIANAPSEILSVGNFYDGATQVRIDDVSVTQIVPEIDPRYGALPFAFATGVLFLLADARKAAKHSPA